MFPFWIILMTYKNSRSSSWFDTIAMSCCSNKKMMIGKKWCLFNLMEIMAFWGQNVFMSFPPAFLQLSISSSSSYFPLSAVNKFSSHSLFYFLWCLSMCVFFCFYLTAFSAFKLIDFLYTIFFLPSTSVIFVLNELCLFSFFSPFCLFYVYVLFGMLRLSLDYWCPCGEILLNIWDDMGLVL